MQMKRNKTREKNTNNKMISASNGHKSEQLPQAMVLQKYEIRIQIEIQMLSMSTADFSNIYHNWIL